MLDDRAFLSNPRQWPSDVICVKKRPKDDNEPRGFTGFSKFGCIISGEPTTIYLRGSHPAEDFRHFKRYNNVDEMIADGWEVD